MQSFRTVAGVAALVVAAICSPATSSAQSTPAGVSKVKPQDDPLRSLSKRRDKMVGATFYLHSTTPYMNSPPGAFYLYFGRTDAGELTELRLVMSYVADNWLFVSKAWAKADGVTVELPQNRTALGWERDHSRGVISEWSDKDLASPVDVALVRMLANAKEVTVRFEGRQFHSDRQVTAKQQKAMREMLTAYDAVNVKPAK